MPVTLQDYLDEVRLYLNDGSATYWSDAQLTFYINKAIKQRDRDTGENRSRFLYALTTGTSVYSITTVAASGTMLAGGASSNPFDVLGITVVWGNMRYPLAQLDFTTVGWQYQPYVGYNDLPQKFAKYGATSVVLGPPPNQDYPVEWDLLNSTTVLAAPTDTDALDYPWTDPVPFKACQFAKVQLQQFEEADRYGQLYMARLTEVVGGARGRGLYDPFAMIRRMRR